jgi:hypothetical protein
VKNNSELFNGQRVCLISFDGQTNSQVEARDDENYWKLIGSKGVISEFGTDIMSDRVLVTFDNNPADLGLACHNPRPKSLWIKIEDLKGSN